MSTHLGCSSSHVKIHKLFYKNIEIVGSQMIFYTKNYLTDCPHVRQTNVKMAKSRNLIKPGWVHQLIGRIDHAKYFWPGTTLMAVAAHPNFQLTNKNYLFYVGTNSKILHTIWVWAHLKFFDKF